MTNRQYFIYKADHAYDSKLYGGKLMEFPRAAKVGRVPFAKTLDLEILYGCAVKIIISLFAMIGPSRRMTVHPFW